MLQKKLEVWRPLHSNHTTINFYVRVRVRNHTQTALLRNLCRSRCVLVHVVARSISAGRG